MFSTIPSRRSVVSIITAITLVLVAVFAASPDKGSAQSVEMQGSVQSISPGDTALKYVVSGPASATGSSCAVAIYDGTTGALIKRATSDGSHFAVFDSNGQLYHPVLPGYGLLVTNRANGGWVVKLGNGTSGGGISIWDLASPQVERARILSYAVSGVQGYFTAGYMGFGTISPSSRIDVVTNVSGGYAAEFVNNGNNSDRHGIMIQAGADNGLGTNHMIRFYTGPDIAPGPVFRGSINVTGSTIQLNTSSDARLKTDIQNTQRQGMAMVRAVPVRDYVFIDSGAAHTGFIAQELETAYPEATSEDKDTRIVEHHAKRIIPAGVPYKGEVAPMDREVEEVTTETFTQTVKCIRPLMLIPILWKAVQEQDEAFLQEKENNSNREARLAALEDAMKGVEGSSMNAGLGGTAGGAELSDEQVRRLSEAVLKDLGVNPWIEISIDQVWEEVNETTPVAAKQTVTRYRLNTLAHTVEPYTVEDMVTQQQPTGRKISQLKAGVRFDEKTGKFYRWCGLSEATPSQTAAALSKMLMPVAAGSYKATASRGANGSLF